MVACHVVMVPPRDFAYDEVAAATNRFQRTPEQLGIDAADVAPAALREFAGAVATLRGSGIDVLELHHTGPDRCPDEVFPNNWFTHHLTQDGHSALVVYPMLAPNRRKERRVDTLNELLSHVVAQPVTVADISSMEDRGEFLEGTGSLVLDRKGRVAYVALSPRTTQAALDEWSRITGYRIVKWEAVDADGVTVYHTNVVMACGEQWSVICLDAIPDLDQRHNVEEDLVASDRAVIPISLDQMHRFCGNILEVAATDGTRRIVMSETAYDAFDDHQLESLGRYGNPCVLAIDVIERIGGGSARCMLAEIF